MKTSSSQNSRHIRIEDRSGITLTEILIAILIMGVGLLQLMELFPIGAIELHQAVKDDRSAAIVASAMDLSEAGQEVLTQTGVFLEDAWAGNVDQQGAAYLQARYQDLADEAANIELQLLEMRPSVPKPRVRRQVEVLLSQCRLIERGLQNMSEAFGLLAADPPSPND